MVQKVVVSIGILINHDSQVFLAKRPAHTTFAGMLEFPGGKVEEHELPEEALKRELYEEIGIKVQDFELFHLEVKDQQEVTQHKIELYFYWVKHWLNNPSGKEGQETFWLPINKLNSDLFPPMNASMIDKLKGKIMQN